MMAKKVWHLKCIGEAKEADRKRHRSFSINNGKSKGLTYLMAIYLDKTEYVNGNK